MRSVPGVVVVTEIPTSDFREGTEADLSRASRYVLRSRRNAFLVGRHIVRTVVGAMRGQRPTDVLIRLSAEGKPYVDEADGNRLEFSIAHSERLLGVAFNLEGAVGLDLEPVTDYGREHAYGLATTVCGGLATAIYAQARRLGSETPGIDCWVALEAISKKIGCGLDTEKLKKFAVGGRYIVQFYQNVLNHRLALSADTNELYRIFRLKKIQSIKEISEIARLLQGKIEYENLRFTYKSSGVTIITS